MHTESAARAASTHKAENVLLNHPFHRGSWKHL